MFTPFYTADCALSTLTLMKSAARNGLDRERREGIVPYSSTQKAGRGVMRVKNPTNNGGLQMGGYLSLQTAARRQRRRECTKTHSYRPLFDAKAFPNKWACTAMVLTHAAGSKEGVHKGDPGFGHSGSLDLKKGLHVLAYF